MRDNGPITSNELTFPADVVLVSKTDPGGRITFANDAFVRMSGYTRDELMGAPHNLVRHPHMPPAAFRDLWTTVKAGRPWDGLVKNRSKNGDFYWVRANVTPVMEDGQLQGYISIRTAPGRQEIAAADAIYTAIRAGRSRGLTVKEGAVVRTGIAAVWDRVACGIASSFGLNLGVLYAAVAASLAAGAMGVGVEIRGPALAVVGLLGIVSTALSMRRMQRAFQRTEQQFAALARGDLGFAFAAEQVHELRVIGGFLRALRAKLGYAEETRQQRDRDAMIARATALREMASRVETVANETGEEVGAATASLGANATELVEAAAAVRGHADTAARAAGESLASAQTVSAAAEELAASIREIANRLASASNLTREAVEESGAAEQTISQLRTEVARIGQIASLIADIAAQTNLLALNATIEAARAGDAGKGFAVVAGEVKTLASQTARATEDISRQIAQIQHATAETVEAVTRIGGKVSEIDMVSAAVAAAMEEQSAATQEISRAVAQSASAAQSVTETMEGVVTIASSTDGKAAVLQSVADALATSTGRSRQTLIETVRLSVADAERRMHVRVRTDLPCELMFNGARYAGRLVNISEGGARAKINVPLAVGLRGELRVAGHNLAVPCNVVFDDAEDGLVSLAFASRITLPPALRDSPRAA